MCTCIYEIRRPPRLKLEGEASRKDRCQSLNFRPKTRPKTASSHPLGLNPAGVSLFRMHAAQSPLRTDCGTFSRAFALLLAVSKMPLRHPVCGRITYHLGLNPAEVSLFRMHAAQSPLRTDCSTFSHAFALLLAVSKMPLRHPVCGRITYPLGLNPAGVSLFRMHAAQSPLRTDCGTFSRAFALLLAVSKMPLRHPVCGRITYHLGLNPAGVSLFRMHAAQSPLRTDCGTFWHALLCL